MLKKDNTKRTNVDQYDEIIYWLKTTIVDIIIDGLGDFIGICIMINDTKTNKKEITSKLVEIEAILKIRNR